MAYLHCHSCDWSQDDFYSEDGYSPANFLKSWNEQLCGDKIDEQFPSDPEFLQENGPITYREVIAREYEKFAKRIRCMKWVTWEQWQREKVTAVCPKCGAQDFDID
ncbi:MAG: hypothetical protein ACYSSO_07390 [Planctomycetota bacterium]